jgi:hypothetical protein
MAADEQPGPARTRIGIEHGSEDGMRNGGREPPAPKASDRQVGESGGTRQDQLPCRQLLKLGAAQRRDVHTARDAFSLAAPQPSAYGRARDVIHGLIAPLAALAPPGSRPGSRLLCRRSPAERRVGSLLRSTAARDPESCRKDPDMDRESFGLPPICGQDSTPAGGCGNRSPATGFHGKPVARHLKLGQL